MSRLLPRFVLWSSGHQKRNIPVTVIREFRDASRPAKGPCFDGLARASCAECCAVVFLKMLFRSLELGPSAPVDFAATRDMIPFLRY